MGLKADQVQELIDFWHAVEYLGKIAESVKLTGSKRKHWLTTQKKRLLRGEIGAVFEELEASLPGRRSKEQATWLNYFRTHGLEHRRMDYAASRSSQMPVGSGAIESRYQANREPTGQKQCDLLASRKRREHDQDSGLDQSRTRRKPFQTHDLRTAHARTMIPTKRESAPFR